MSHVVIPHIVSTKFDKAFKCNKKWTNGPTENIWNRGRVPTGSWLYTCT